MIDILYTFSDGPIKLHLAYLVSLSTDISVISPCRVLFIIIELGCRCSTVVVLPTFDRSSLDSQRHFRGI